MVRFRNVKGFFFWEMVCFLLDALESRVHFEHLGDGLAALGSELVAPETTKTKQKRKKESKDKKRMGKERGKSQRVRKCAKERIKRGSLQECKGILFYGEMVCFLPDGLESRVHFEHLSECLAAIGSDLVVPETAKKKNRKGKQGKKTGKEMKKVSACENVPRSGSSVVRFRNVKGCSFLGNGVFLTRCFGESCSL